MKFPTSTSVQNPTRKQHKHSIISHLVKKGKKLLCHSALSWNVCEQVIHRNMTLFFNWRQQNFLRLGITQLCSTAPSSNKTKPNTQSQESILSLTTSSLPGQRHPFRLISSLSASSLHSLPHKAASATRAHQLAGAKLTPRTPPSPGWCLQQLCNFLHLLFCLICLYRKPLPASTAPPVPENIIPGTQQHTLGHSSQWFFLTGWPGSSSLCQKLLPQPPEGKAGAAASKNLFLLGSGSGKFLFFSSYRKIFFCSSVPQRPP